MSLRPVKMMKIKEVDELADLPEGQEWWAQDKWDGYFVQVLRTVGTTQIISRRGQHYEEKIPKVVQALSYLPDDTLLLGELVYVDEEGNQDVGGLTSIVGSGKDKALERQAELPGTLKIVFHDVLFHKGNKTADESYDGRLSLLERVVRKGEHVDVVTTYREEDLNQVYDRAIASGMEGVVLKNPHGTYPVHYSGEESSSRDLQYKLKKMSTLDVVAFDYELGTGKNANTLGALFIGLYEDSDLTEIGKVGTGFSDAERDEYLRKIKRGNFVVEVRFLRVTQDNKLRHPSFIRERPDKKPKQCKMKDLKGSSTKAVRELVPNPFRRNFDYGSYSRGSEA